MERAKASAGVAKSILAGCYSNGSGTITNSQAVQKQNFAKRHKAHWLAVTATAVVISPALSSSQAVQKQNFAKRHKAPSFEVGVSVLLHNNQQDGQKGGKLEVPWMGLYTISGITNVDPCRIPPGSFPVFSGAPGEDIEVFFLEFDSACKAYGFPPVERCEKLLDADFDCSSPVASSSRLLNNDRDALRYRLLRKSLKKEALRFLLACDKSIRRTLKLNI